MEKNVTYQVISIDPFIVEFHHIDGRKREARYKRALTQEELKGQVKTIFDCEVSMFIEEYGDELLLVQGKNTLLHLPKVIL